MQPDEHRRLLERVADDMDRLGDRLHDVHEGDRTEAYRLAHLTTGALAGTVAVISLALETNVTIGPVASLLSGAGVAGLVTALVVLRSAYADRGGGKTLEMGYQPGPVLRRMEAAAAEEADVWLRLIRYKHESALGNAELIAWRRRRRDFGYRLSLWSAAMVATATALIVGGV